jgi:hypothetical protein
MAAAKEIKQRMVMAQVCGGDPLDGHARHLPLGHLHTQGFSQPFAARYHSVINRLPPFGHSTRAQVHQGQGFRFGQEPVGGWADGGGGGKTAGGQGGFLWAGEVAAD